MRLKWMVTWPSATNMAAQLASQRPSSSSTTIYGPSRGMRRNNSQLSNQVAATSSSPCSTLLNRAANSTRPVSPMLSAAGQLAILGTASRPGVKRPLASSRASANACKPLCTSAGSTRAGSCPNSHVKRQKAPAKITASHGQPRYGRASRATWGFVCNTSSVRLRNRTLSINTLPNK